MPTEIADTIYSKVKTLSPEVQEDVLNFVTELELRSTREEQANGADIEDLWREIDEIVAGVPEAAWNDLPTDGAINVDHYLYGAAKRSK